MSDQELSVNPGRKWATLTDLRRGKEPFGKQGGRTSMLLQLERSMALSDAGSAQRMESAPLSAKSTFLAVNFAREVMVRSHAGKAERLATVLKKISVKFGVPANKLAVLCKATTEAVMLSVTREEGREVTVTVRGLAVRSRVRMESAKEVIVT